jgi:hypothetical protein
LTLALWVLVGSLGLIASAVRVMASLTSAPARTNWETHETQTQRILVMVGLLGLFLLGLFPQWVLPLWTKLPAIFEHLGQ